MASLTQIRPRRLTDTLDLYETGPQYDPWFHVSRLGVPVIHQELDGIVAFYSTRDHQPVIVLDSRLTPAERRASLAHEIM